MINRIDHIAIAVRDYEKALFFFKDVLGAIPGTSARDDSMKYLWQNLALGDLTRLELLTPTGPGSFLDNFLRDREGGAHHITLHTGDIRAAKNLLDRHRIPYFGFNEYGDIWKELFIHPRDAFGVLIQIAEFRPDDWIDETVRMEGGRKWEVNPENDGARLTLAHPGGGKVTIELTGSECRKLARELVDGAGPSA